MPDALTGLFAAAEEAPTYDVAFVPPEWVLVLLGFTMVLAFMTLIMTKRLTPMVALILVPTAFGLFAGAGLGLGDMILDAIGAMAPTAALLMFAIMFFGIMIDVGLFDPLIRLITRLLGDDPAKVVLGTAILAGAVSLDGDGSTTFIITTSAMLPIYLRLGMSPVVLTCVAGLMNGTLNIVPWGGPTVRAATALGLQPTDIFVPMLPALGAGIVVTLGFAWILGLQERRRLGRLDSEGCWSGPTGDRSRRCRRSSAEPSRSRVHVRRCAPGTWWSSPVDTPLSRPRTSIPPIRPWPTRCWILHAPPSGRSSSGSTWCSPSR